MANRILPFKIHYAKTIKEWLIHQIRVFKIKKKIETIKMSRMNTTRSMVRVQMAMFKRSLWLTLQIQRKNCSLMMILKTRVLKMIMKTLKKIRQMETKLNCKITWRTMRMIPTRKKKVPGQLKARSRLPPSLLLLGKQFALCQAEPERCAGLSLLMLSISRGVPSCQEAAPRRAYRPPPHRRAHSGLESAASPTAPRRTCLANLVLPAPARGPLSKASPHRDPRPG